MCPQPSSHTVPRLFQKAQLSHCVQIVAVALHSSSDSFPAISSSVASHRKTPVPILLYGPSEASFGMPLLISTALETIALQVPSIPDQNLNRLGNIPSCTWGEFGVNKVFLWRTVAHFIIIFKNAKKKNAFGDFCVSYNLPRQKV
jgi:hypothetical protein